MTRKTPQRRKVPMWMIGAIVAVLLATTGLVYYQFIALEGPVPEDAGAQYAGLEQGYTDQGFPRLGSANAPVLVEDFSSYACPHCLDFHREQFREMLDEIAAGQVQFVFIPVPNVGPGAKTAAAGLLCAGEQGKLWTMHDVLFYWQERFLTRTFDIKRLREAATTLGLDTDAFETCLDAERTETVLEAVRAEVRRRGITGTPTLFINGERVKDYREFEQIGG